AHWSHNNPVDVLGDALPDRYAQAVQIASKNPDTDGMLVILTPQAVCDPADTARKLAPLAKLEGKPILASWMGGEAVTQAQQILQDAGIPCFEFPDAAARAFCNMWRYTSALDALYETPALSFEPEQTAVSAVARAIIDKVRNAGRTLLNE